MKRSGGTKTPEAAFYSPSPNQGFVIKYLILKFRFSESCRFVVFLH